MKHIKFLFLISIFFISCSEETEVNNYVLNQEQLVEVLYDFHLIDAASKQGVISNNRNNQIKHAQYKGILEKHNIGKAKFDSSMTYWINQPEMLKVIYEELENKLNDKHKALNPRKKKED